MFVYRDTEDTPAASGHAAAGAARAEPAPGQDAAFWYGRDGEPGQESSEPVRGPFEPLNTSAGAADSSGQADPPQPAPDPEHPGELAAHQEPGKPAADVHARKLEQIKDLYLTAETIGEENVAKHFDQFLAQQRELIGDYIKQSKAALHDDTQAAGPTA